MDILDRLMREHRKAEKLISKLAGAQQGPRRLELVEELTDALYTHMVVEERFVYPIVADILGARAETEAETEHDLAREGLEQLNELVDRPGFGAALDMAAAPAAERGLAGVLAERPETLVIDLTDVSFMDSRGLSVLLHAQAAAGEVTLRGATGRVRELFMLAGVDQAFRLEPTA